MSSPVSSAITVPRYHTVSEQSNKPLGAMLWTCLHVTVGGLGRSMCSRRCQRGICVNRSPLHYKAPLVYAVATTYCWIRSDDFDIWINLSRVYDSRKCMAGIVFVMLLCSCTCGSPTTVNSFREGH